jgi:hypothetical protein
VELVSGEYAFDSVPRLLAFREGHPEISIMTPVDTASPFWKAFNDDDGSQITVQHDLGNLLDVLEAWVLARQRGPGADADS